MVAKKEDPNFGQFSAYLPKELLEEFKEECKHQKLDYSDGLEIALRNWLKSPDSRTTPYFKRILKLLLSGTRPKAAEVLEFAAILEEETENVLPIFLAPTITDFLIKLSRKERPSESEIVVLAHDIGVDTAKLLEIVALCTIKKKNGEISNGERNGS